MAIKHWSAADYRKLGKTAPGNDSPWALQSNPNKHYHNTRNKPILGFVMHITAGLDDYTLPDTSADSTQKYGSTTTTKASWHVCIDSDGISPALPDTATAWHAGVSGYNFNSPTLGIEIGKRTTNWDVAPKDWVERTLRNVAVWAAPRVIKYNIPITLQTNRDKVQSMINQNQPFGFVTHRTLTPSTRSDPAWHSGRDTFPWNQFFTYLREEVARLKGGTVAAPTQLTVTMNRGDTDATTGSQVSLLQRMLNGVRKAGLTIDGSFGPATERAVIAAHQAWGIAAPHDRVGPGFRTRINAEWAKLNAPAPTPTPTPTPAPTPTPTPTPTPLKLTAEQAIAEIKKILGRM